MWPEHQDRFAKALLDPARPVPDAIAAQSGGSEDRFAVYRNNVVVGIGDSLAATYPVVAALVGAEFFNAMAGVFVRSMPPTSPIMIDYGGDLADFIAGFTAADGLPYLADVARLEWAISRAYHAADAEPITLAALAGIAEAALGCVRPRLHPSLRLVRSPWPIAAIWRAHQGGDPATASAALPETGECAMVVRPGLEVDIRVLDGAVFDFVAALAAGETLDAALERLATADAPDAAVCLAQLFETGAVVGIDKQRG